MTRNNNKTVTALIMSK